MLIALSLLAANVPVGMFALLALILAIVGLVMIVQGSILGGIVMLIIAAAVGPGGWWIFR
jgi:hypothetical protein